jgi:predicted TIM-barrel fold metal-dependent hydrolase
MRAQTALARTPSRRTVFAAGALVFAAPALADPQRGAGRTAAPLVDHHIHIASPALTAFVEEVARKDPSAFAFLSKDIFNKLPPADVITMFASVGVKRAVVLSTAYLFAPGASGPFSAEALQSLRQENHFNVEAGLRSGGRLIPFVSVNPFAPNALDELSYWARKPGVKGLKLHLGSSGFRAGDPGHAARLALVIAKARSERLPLVIHLRGAGPVTKADVRTFIDKDLSQAGELPVQIAHGAGYAGADPATILSLSTFGEAIAQGAPGAKNLVFDISGVVLPDAVAAALGSSDAQLQIFVDLMRTIGLNRFVVGSDWPATGQLGPYYALMRQKLPVTDAEWAGLCTNLAPYLLNPR